MLTTKALEQSRNILPTPPKNGVGSAPVAGNNPSSPPRPSVDPFSSSRQSALRRISFYSGLGLLFLRLTAIPELVFSLTGVNTYLLYLFAPAAVLGAFATGSLGRTFQSRAAWFWAAFFGWMILATPMSYWVGGSVQRILSYGRVDFVFLMIMGGLALNWDEIRLAIATVASAAVVDIAIVRWIGVGDMGGRTNLSDMIGSIGNSNDLAAHLLLVLPFLWFVITDSKRSKFLRVGALGVLGLGFVTMLGTGSRGALIGLGLSIAFVLARATASQRVIAVIAMVLVGVFTVALLPAVTLTRLGSLFGEEHKEAEESSRSREYLFNKSLEFTGRFPIFGVGPDQFPNYEGQERVAAGLVGNWHATHCAWTQVSSECGIPALLFFAGGLFSALHLVWRAHRRARRLGLVEIGNATLCYLTGMIGFLTAITFLANAYTYYLPAMVGLAISMSFVANRFMDQHQSSNNNRVPGSLRPAV